jgi:hypothetical protein
VIRFAVAALLVSTACKKDDPDRPPPARASMSEAERQRADDACRAYVDRLCGCARDRPALADRCELHGGRPEMIDMLLRTAGDTGVSTEDAARLVDQARQVVQNCIEDAVKLESEGCR